jgi:hypothetical protein
MLHLYIYSISCRSSYSKIASAPEQIGLLELSVAATGKALTVTVEVAVNGRLQVPTYVSKI